MTKGTGKCSHFSVTFQHHGHFGLSNFGGVHCRTFSSNPDLYPLEASSTLQLGQPKNLEDIVKCSLGDNIVPG